MANVSILNEWIVESRVYHLPIDDVVIGLFGDVHENDSLAASKPIIRYSKSCSSKINNYVFKQSRFSNTTNTFHKCTKKS